MGLDFNRSEASWSYGGFHEFRKALAAEINIDLETMEGFADNGKPWAEIDDPIVPFLNHSDSDGELAPEECHQVAPRLRELVAGWPDDTSARGYDKESALVLADDMETCAEEETPLGFCCSNLK